MRCTNDDTHPCLLEKTDHILGDTSRTIIHQQERVISEKADQTSKPKKTRQEHGFDVIEKVWAWTYGLKLTPSFLSCFRTGEEFCYVMT
jgi:hypothetical protein